MRATPSTPPARPRLSPSPTMTGPARRPPSPTRPPRQSPRGGYAWYGRHAVRQPGAHRQRRLCARPAAQHRGGQQRLHRPRRARSRFIPAGRAPAMCWWPPAATSSDAPDKNPHLETHTTPANAAGYTLAPNGQTAAVTIADDDQPPPKPPSPRPPRRCTKARPPGTPSPCRLCRPAPST